MSREWRLYVNDIHESCCKIRNFTAGMDREAFEADARTYDAVVRNLEVIGEAVKSIPDRIKKRAPEIEWKNIGGMRDFLAHGYFGIDNDILWPVVAHRLYRSGRPARRTGQKHLCGARPQTSRSARKEES